MSSNRRPWFPWYPKEYNADEKVKGLSDDADLLYRRILDVLWEASDLHLPCNCTKLALQLARGWSAERFKCAWDEIMYPGFELLKTTDDGQFVYSQRLCHEAQKIESISKNRAKGGLAKAQQMQVKCKSNAVHMSCHPDPYPDPDINKKEKEKPKRETEKSCSCLKSYRYPDWLNRSLWSDFCKTRSRIKKPITTERTISGLLNDLKKQIDAGFDQDAIIQQSIDHCWQSFFPIKPSNGKKDDREDWI